MDLDKRIKDITDIQSVINSNKGIIGKRGYFAKNIKEFKDLSKCKYNIVHDYREDDRCFCYTLYFTNGQDNTWYPYFISEDSLKPIEKKYRPFTLDEFINLYSLGDTVIVRRNLNKDKTIYKLFTEYGEDNDKVHLGSYWYTLKDLYDRYELYTREGWKPFGIAEG